MNTEIPTLISNWQALTIGIASSLLSFIFLVWLATRIVLATVPKSDPVVRIAKR